MQLASSRDALRRHYRHLRRTLSPEEQELAAHNLLTTCLRYPAFLQATIVAFYQANDGEIATHALIDYCWQQAKTVLLPVIDPLQPEQLVFIEYRPDSPLTTNKYGITEPLYDPEKQVALHAIDIIFTPLVAFDASGNRLGMGGGYYDRTLAQLDNHNTTNKIIGLAHDIQQVDKLPTQSWDIPLQGIITPSQIFMLNGSV